MCLVLESGLGEEHCPMTVGLKVNTDVVMFRSMMQVLDAGGHAFDRKTLG
jgi:hypothetical protein